MLALGPLAFVQPWLLAALLGLPALYWLLRLTPPTPRRIAFPPLALIRRLVAREETPARTPLWLLILRLIIAALVILALARPVLDPTAGIPGKGPLLVVLDDGWAAAPRWPSRIDTLRGLLEQADRDARDVVLVRAAPGENGISVARGTARDLIEALPGIEPRPWPVDRAAVEDAVEALDLDEATPIWLSDGIAVGDVGVERAGSLARLLRQRDALVLLQPTSEELPLVLDIPPPGGEQLDVQIRRADRRGERAVGLRALGPGGEILARSDGVLEAGARATGLTLELPSDLMGRVARLELVPDEAVGGTVLFDERWRRKSVGIAAAPQTGVAQPLLAEAYYVERAFAPFATVTEGSITELLTTPISLLVVTDRRRMDDAERALLEPWMEEGGVLLRFAGPKLAEGGDDFVPVPLREGDRRLGGALSWARPLALAPVSPDSPLAGLQVNSEARVNRQVLAQPAPGVAAATLVSLEDGTPLITGKRLGRGWLILVHTTANTSWTSLPLSGLFVDLLRRILALATGTGGTSTGLLRVDQMLDAHGRLIEPDQDIRRVPGSEFGSLIAGPAAPPGLWAQADDLEHTNELARVALNVQSAIGDIVPIDARSIASEVRGYEQARELDLFPWLLLVALLLVFADIVIAYAFRGLLPLRVPAASAILLLAATVPAMAQESEIAPLTNQTRLAYVRTGLDEVDQKSAAGLYGLGVVLAQRTTIETGEPVAVDLHGGDDLALFSLLYWAVPPEHPRISKEALDRLGVYLRRGGLVLIDTSDAARLLPGQEHAGPGERRLAEILRSLDVPPLVPVPRDHVLTRSFYLLQDFPGRFAGRPVWVDETPSGINDGVASMIIGAHDWAGAWATDPYGRSLLPVVPGGERQREIARRFGVNIVMYALTGNYKTDQVHVPALLERLGQ